MMGKQAEKKYGVIQVELNRLEDKLSMSDAALDDVLIHKLRVLSKRVRAEAAFVKNKQHADRSKRKARKLAKYLADARENSVFIETLGYIFSGSIPDEIQSLRNQLIIYQKQQSIDKTVVLKLFCAMRDAIAEETDLDFSQKQRLLNESWQRIISVAQTLSQADPESYHRWRKMIKAHLFYLKRLSPSQNESIEKVKQLGELLGNLHDFHELYRRFPELEACSLEVTKCMQEYENRLFGEIQTCWADMRRV